jgi:F0F1-type ATP synthase beta subunit
MGVWSNERTTRQPLRVALSAHGRKNSVTKAVTFDNFVDNNIYRYTLAGTEVSMIDRMPSAGLPTYFG